MSHLSKVANFNLTHLHLAPLLVLPRLSFAEIFGIRKLSCGIVLRSAVSVEHRFVTDRQTDTWLGHIHASMASRGSKLIKSILISWMGVDVRMCNMNSKQMNIWIIEKCSFFTHFFVSWKIESVFMRQWKNTACVHDAALGVEGNGSAEWRKQGEWDDNGAWRQVSTCRWRATTSYVKVTTSFHRRVMLFTFLLYTCSLYTPIVPHCLRVSGTTLCSKKSGPPNSW